jgi:hypothetical protein
MMVRKFFAALAACVLVAVLCGCASSSPSDICGGAKYAVRLDLKGSPELYGSGSNVIGITWHSDTEYSARVVSGDATIYLLEVMAGPSDDHLKSYGVFKPEDNQREARIPTREGNESNLLFYACGGGGAG